jgi:hypothetical protein
MQKKVIKINLKEWSEVVKEADDWSNKVINIFGNLMDGNQKIYNAIEKAYNLIDPDGITKDFTILEGKFKELGVAPPPNFAKSKEQIIKRSKALETIIEQIYAKYDEMEVLNAKIDGIFKI